MNADIDERTARSEYTRSLAHESREIVNVGVREQRNYRVEVAIRERKRHRVRSKEIGLIADAVAREAELVSRDIDSCRTPTEGEQAWHVQAGAAAKVETAPRATTK